MPNYEVGNLILELTTKLNSADTALDTIQKRLSGTASAIARIQKNVNNFTVSSTNLTQLSTALSQINRAFSGTGIQSIGQNATALRTASSAITRMNTSIMGLDARTFYNKVSQMTRILTPFIEKVASAETSLVALSRIIPQINKTKLSIQDDGLGVATQNYIGGLSRSTQSNINFLSIVGKIRSVAYSLRRIATLTAQALNYAISYNETLNLWQVANRENIALADEFINKMTKAYGISEAAAMNYQAIFKNMLSALGDLSDATSSTLSMQLMQMALDYSSLYNVTIERAMQQFQAVLSGQVRPIRSVSGYDITETTIFDLYESAGGEKTMRQLSQLEKRLLRIVAVFNQMGATGALGDMEKTIESAANQSRVMTEQAQEVATWAGQVAMQWLNVSGILSQINGFLIALGDTLEAMAYSLGYEEPNFLDGLVLSSESAEEAIDSVQGKLLSFDRFEALSSQDTNLLGIDPTVEKLLQNINLQMNDFEMHAQKLAQDWLLKWFDDSDEDGMISMNELLDQAEAKIQKIEDIALQILSIAGAFLTLNLIQRIQSITIATHSLGQAFLGVGITGLIYSILQLATRWDDLNAAQKTIYFSLLGLSLIITAVSAYLIYKNKQTLASTVATVANTQATIANAQASYMAAAANAAEAQSLQLQAMAYRSTEAAQVGLLKNNSLISSSFGTLAARIGKVGSSALMFATSLGVLISNYDELSTTAKVFLGIATAMGAVLTVLAVKGWISAKAGAANWIAWSGGLAAVGIIAALTGVFAAMAYEAKKSVDVAQYATGGFPEKGEMYIANENGRSELIGRIGNRPAVSNNDQIVEAVSGGVYRAVVSANMQNKSQVNGDVYIDGKKAGRILAKSVVAEGNRIGIIKNR